MGKLLVLSVSDHEEHIFNRIMAAIIDEPEFDHITLPFSDAILSFPNIEIRLKEQTVSCRGQLVTLTHHEFAVLAYLARHPGWVFSASQIYEAVFYLAITTRLSSKSWQTAVFTVTKCGM